jgi:diguanylate cyclase (GGDEF)-like protein
MLSRPFAENALHKLAAVLFPAVLLCISVVLALQATPSDVSSEQELQLRGMPEPTGRSIDHQGLSSQLLAKPAHLSVPTHLSAKPFWLLLDAQAPKHGQRWVVEFPSRHSTDIECWDRHTDAKLGLASRTQEVGQMVRSRSGFAINLAEDTTQIALLCRTDTRGPAKLTAHRWLSDDLAQAQLAHDRVGAMIEASIGMLALAMLLMSIINRSQLYGAFVVWLLLSMRMASLSAGTDFEWLGLQLPPEWLTPIRHWTICMYATATVALFGRLFRPEIAALPSRRLLNAMQINALALLVCGAVLSFEQMLPIVWVSSTIGTLIMLYYLACILSRNFSMVALWYALSMVVTVVAGLNEVVAAAIGMNSLINGVNSVTAALVSALLVFAAAAEHMRVGRTQFAAAQRMLKTAYEDSPIGLFTLREGSQIASNNPAFRDMLMSVDCESTGDFSLIFGSEAKAEVEILRQRHLPAAIELQTRVARADSPEEDDRWFAIKLSTHDGSVIEGSLQDISEKVRATQRLEFLVNHDPLTEVLNLRGLSRHCDRASQQARSLAYFDLDRFKLINDLYGHGAGDAVLMQVCDRMRSQLGPEDLLARVGGDEFVVAFVAIDIEEAKQRCENICALISSAPFKIDSQRFTLSISAGLVSTDNFGNSTLKEVVSAADTLCRMAKKRPNESLVAMERGSNFFKHHQDELALISCLERGETPQGLFLLMQPEISLTQPFDSLNFEVLVRMRKANGDIVPAGVIIEAAEAHGKTGIIDMWVITTLIAWLETNLDRLPRTHFVGVNLSGGSLNDASFVDALFELLDLHPRVVPLLCLEITETVALNDMRHMQRFIDRVQSIGAKVSLDDFGAGYSSFGYLKGLSVDALKLDGSMVRDAAVNPASMAILTAIGGLVKNLGMKSIGEFAENLQTIKALVNAGVDYAQGYGISKPVAPDRILAATSGADFIEDPEILAFVKQLQAQPNAGLTPFAESADLWTPSTMH